MKRNSDWIFLALVLLVVVGIVGLAGYSIVHSRSQNLRLAEAKFESLKVRVKSAFEMGGSVSSKAFREQVGLAFKTDESVLGIVLRDPRSGTEYLIPEGSPYIATERLPSGARKDAFTGFHPYAAVVKGAPIVLKDGAERWLEAAFVVLPARAVTDPLRLSLLGLLIIVFLSATALFFLYARGEGSGAARPEPLAFPEPSAPRYEPPSLHSAIEDEEFTVPEIADDISADPFAAPSIPDFPSASLPPLEPTVEAASGFSLPPLDEEPAAPRYSRDEPRGLYSERSGLGWESYLEDRLEAEIDRASTAGLDCSLILAELEREAYDPTDHAVVARSISSYFKYKDLAFERGSSGFAVILPGQALDGAMKSAEGFLAALAGGPWAESVSGSPAVRMGVTSLAGRRIAARELIEEAAIALEKALAEKKTRMIGFRANPDRYRDFSAGKL